MSLAESLAQAVGIGQISERARLIHGDCLDPVTGLASLPDQSVDHVITDPPFSERVHRRLGLEGRKDGHAKRGTLAFGHITAEQIDALAAQMTRVATRWILIFCDELTLVDWALALERHGARYMRKGTWDKVNPMPQMSGDRPATGTEEIVIGHAGAARSRWNGGGKAAVWRSNVPHGTDREHPTQKPLLLMRALVEDFTDAGETILDPFAGSGTTGVAALTLGRRFIGWEMDAKHHATAVRRIGETREQPSLLGTRAPRAKQQGLGL